MAKQRREEVYNTYLAHALADSGLDAEAENIHRQHRRSYPDVIVHDRGVRTIIEARFTDTHLAQDTTDRLRAGLCDVAVSLRYPDSLKETRQADIVDALKEARFPEIKVYQESDASPQVDGAKSLHDLVEIIRSAASSAINQNDLQNRLRHASTELQTAVSQYVDQLDLRNKDQVVAQINHHAAPTASVVNLEIFVDPDTASERKLRKNLNEILHILSFILLDAIIFHDILAESNDEIASINEYAGQSRHRHLRNEWEKILRIDYSASFKVAHDLLARFAATSTTEKLLQRLIDLATDLLASGVLQKHDFMGRLYHRLLLPSTGEAFATYYTALGSAHLLARSAVAFFEQEVESAGNDFDYLNIADFACGSGTLLSASYLATRDAMLNDLSNHSAVAKFHQEMIENRIFGIDVLSYAVHLTLTGLALLQPDVRFSRCNIYQVPVGISGGTASFGSLEILRQQPQLLSLGTQASLGEEEDMFAHSVVAEALDHQVDLALMNPPFSRGSKPKKIFAYEDPQDRREMIRQRNDLKEEGGIAHFDSSAGTGALFVPVAGRSVKKGGRIAFVLPRSMLSGISWAQMREYVEEDMAVEAVFSNHDPEGDGLHCNGWAFSESTNIGEVMFIARRLRDGESRADNETLFINVTCFPRNEFEAYHIVQELKRTGVLAGACAYAEIRNGNTVVANAQRLPTGKYYGRNWLVPCLFANRFLNQKTVEILSSDKLVSIEQYLEDDIDSSGGYDISPTKQLFDRTQAATPYPMLWTHSQEQNTMQLSKRHLEFGNPKKDRADQVFSERASTFLLSERPHLQTSRTFALIVTRNVMATPCWELQLKGGKELAKALCVWFNSTYGVIAMLSACTSSQGEIFKLKKTQLTNVLVPSLSAQQRSELAAVYDRMKRETLATLSDSWNAAASGNGTRYELDAAINEILDVPLDRHYGLLAQEPIVTGQRIPEAQ